MDTGIDTAHADLKIIYGQIQEKNKMGKTNDHNGYTDDLHGWDFIGGKTAMFNMKLRTNRLIREQQGFYDSISMAPSPNSISGVISPTEK